MLCFKYIILNGALLSVYSAWNMNIIARSPKLSDGQTDTGAACTGSTFNLASGVPECTDTYDHLNLIMSSVKQIERYTLLLQALLLMIN